mmetsp:Transcript_8140/g.25591  ORF Transcript_8140/g.25591 Transcript_8140/m.25591 type:complete len:363 (-) Transcript_8140:808-1896(-)
MAAEGGGDHPFGGDRGQDGGASHGRGRADPRRGRGQLRADAAGAAAGRAGQHAAAAAGICASLRHHVPAADAEGVLRKSPGPNRCPPLRAHPRNPHLLCHPAGATAGVARDAGGSPGVHHSRTRARGQGSAAAAPAAAAAAAVPAAVRRERPPQRVPDARSDAHGERGQGDGGAVHRGRAAAPDGDAGPRVHQPREPAVQPLPVRVAGRARAQRVRAVGLQRGRVRGRALPALPARALSRRGGDHSVCVPDHGSTPGTPLRRSAGRVSVVVGSAADGRGVGEPRQHPRCGPPAERLPAPRARCAGDAAATGARAAAVQAPHGHQGAHGQRVRDRDQRHHVHAVRIVPCRPAQHAAADADAPA